MASADIAVRPSDPVVDVVVEKPTPSAAVGGGGLELMSSAPTRVTKNGNASEASRPPAAANGHDLTVSSPERGPMSEELKE